MTTSDDLECPLCMEPFDDMDKEFYPCICGYQVCGFCWNWIRNESNNLCPACRSPYSDVPVKYKTTSSTQTTQTARDKKKNKQSQHPSSNAAVVITGLSSLNSSVHGVNSVKSPIFTADQRTQLSKIRVVQKNLVYVTGLPTEQAEPSKIKESEAFFNKFGRVFKIVFNKAAPTTLLPNNNSNANGPVITNITAGSSATINAVAMNSVCAYITYTSKKDASNAILKINGFKYDDHRILRASFGTTKYCSFFLRNLPCPNTECMYLHELGEEDDSFSKENGELTNPEQNSRWKKATTIVSNIDLMEPQLNDSSMADIIPGSAIPAPAVSVVPASALIVSALPPSVGWAKKAVAGKGLNSPAASAFSIKEQLKSLSNESISNITSQKLKGANILKPILGPISYSSLVEGTAINSTNSVLNPWMKSPSNVSSPEAKTAVVDNLQEDNIEELELKITEELVIASGQADNEICDSDSGSDDTDSISMNNMADLLESDEEDRKPSDTIISNEISVDEDTKSPGNSWENSLRAMFPDINIHVSKKSTNNTASGLENTIKETHIDESDKDIFDSYWDSLESKEPMSNQMHLPPAVNGLPQYGTPIGVPTFNHLQHQQIQYHNNQQANHVHHLQHVQLMQQQHRMALQQKLQQRDGQAQGNVYLQHPPLGLGMGPGLVNPPPGFDMNGNKNMHPSSFPHSSTYPENSISRQSPPPPPPLSTPLLIQQSNLQKNVYNDFMGYYSGSGITNKENINQYQPRFMSEAAAGQSNHPPGLSLESTYINNYLAFKLKDDQMAYQQNMNPPPPTTNIAFQYQPYLQQPHQTIDPYAQYRMNQ